MSEEEKEYWKLIEHNMKAATELSQRLKNGIETGKLLIGSKGAK